MNNQHNDDSPHRSLGMHGSQVKRRDHLCKSCINHVILVVNKIYADKFLDYVSVPRTHREPHDKSTKYLLEVHRATRWILAWILETPGANPS